MLVLKDIFRVFLRPERIKTSKGSSLRRKHKNHGKEGRKAHKKARKVGKQKKEGNRKQKRALEGQAVRDFQGKNCLGVPSMEPYCETKIGENRSGPPANRSE